MNQLFCASDTADTSPSLTVPVNDAQAGRTSPTVAVSPAPMTDGQREAAIGLAASRMQHHMEMWERFGVLSDHAAAVRAKDQMYELIRGRSAAQVARMEQDRGLG